MNKELKIIVTGVKGQLGYDCVRELKQRGYQNVLGIDRDELDIIQMLSCITQLGQQQTKPKR